MNKKPYKPKSGVSFTSSLVTEVTRQGELIGVTVWERSRNVGVFVEAEDMTAIGHVLKKLGLRYSRQARRL